MRVEKVSHGASSSSLTDAPDSRREPPISSQPPGNALTSPPAPSAAPASLPIVPTAAPSTAAPSYAVASEPALSAPAASVPAASRPAAPATVSSDESAQESRVPELGDMDDLKKEMKTPRIIPPNVLSEEQRYQFLLNVSIQFSCSLDDVEVVIAQNDQRHYVALLLVRNARKRGGHWAADVDLLLRGEPTTDRISAYEALQYALEARALDGINSIETGTPFGRP